MTIETKVIPALGQLLLKARQAGITIRPDSNGDLRLSPSRLVTPGIFYGVRRIKPQLLALLGKLEVVGAADDTLILEAVALFDVKPDRISPWLKDAETRATLPFPAPRLPASASEDSSRLTGKVRTTANHIRMLN